jgi:hypothetical protein
MRAALSAIAVALIVAATTLAYAGGRDWRGGKPYACNPQAECLARAASLEGAAAAAARRDCGRMPTTGTCFSQDDAQSADRAGRPDADRSDRSDRKRR